MSVATLDRPLVERLVQQGMSSEEIERVLNAVEKNEGGKKVWWKF